MITTLEAITDTIVTGVVLSRFAAKDNDIVLIERQMLTLRAINYGVIDKNGIESVKLAKEIESTKRTQRGDIILKMNKPYYLTGFINSMFAKEFFATANGASAASLLKIKDIKKLPVYLPSLTEQKAIGAIFQTVCDRQLLLKEMMRQEAGMAENILMDAAREVWEREK